MGQVWRGIDYAHYYYGQRIYRRFREFAGRQQHGWLTRQF